MIKRFINILQGGEARAYPSLSPERQIVQRWWNCRQKQGANRGAKPWEVLSAGNALQNRAISTPQMGNKAFFFPSFPAWPTGSEVGRCSAVPHITLTPHPCSAPVPGPTAHPSDSSPSNTTSEQVHGMGRNCCSLSLCCCGVKK